MTCCCGKQKRSQDETYQRFKNEDASFYEYADAVPKYFNDQIGKLSEGISFTVTGNLSVNCERFSINLVYNNDSRDVALHINPRLPQNYIVRNTKVQDIWGNEEVSSALPFLLSRGEEFSIQVLVTEACYMISVNGQHFAAYTHRIPYRDVRILEVKGDYQMRPECVDIVNIRGDIKLWEVAIQGNTTYKKPKVRSAMERAISAWKRAEIPQLQI
uniref:Galectin n=1 Tax=Drosophila melanogaster TaxID=7227 RepID=C0PV05_DROME|nr:MIP07035p [Drosophila melanogaster]